MKILSLITHPHVVPNPLFMFSRQRTHAEREQRWLHWLRSGVLYTQVFFAHKKYSRIFVKFRLNPWCHMDYFTDLLATFLCVDRGNILAVYGGSESSQNSSKISYFVLQWRTKVLRFGLTWGWVINDRIFIFEWTIPLRKPCIITVHQISVVIVN